MKKSKALFFLMVALLVLSFGVVVYADTPEGETTITIFHTNDTHGRFQHGSWGSNNAIGIDTVASIVAATENALFIDAGDTIHGVPFVNLGHGANAIELMNLAGVNLMAPGNHEFNFGLERLLELENLADFGFISANVFWREDSSLVFDPYVIIEVDGVSLGFFGLITPAAYTTTHPNNIVDVYFGRPIDAAHEAVAALKAHEVDVIIAISHVGLDGPSNTRTIANAVPGIDLIIDGHSHDVGYEVVNGVLITQADGHGAYLGRVDITVAEDGDVSLVASLIDQEYAHENFEPNAVVAAAIAAMVEELDEAMSEVVAYSPVDLDGDRVRIRTTEMPLGNLVAESMAWASGAELALMNSGGIRDSFYAGPLTLGDILRVLAFPNYVVVVEITPAYLWEALENGVAPWSADNGRFPQIYGFEFTFDGYAEPGNRVTSLTINGVAQNRENHETLFTLAVNDFLAAGGDGYENLVMLTQVGQAGLISDVFTQFITVGEADMTVQVDGRMVQVGVESVDEPPVEDDVPPTDVDIPPVIEPISDDIPVVDIPTQEEVIVVVETGPGTGTVVNCWMLNVRASGSSSARILAYLRRGDVVTVLETVGTQFVWHRIRFGDIEGWVFGRYLEIH